MLSGGGDFVRVKPVVLLTCLLSVSLIGASCGGYTELEYREPLDTVKVDLTIERTLDPSEITLDQPGTYLFEVKNVTEDVAHAFEIKATEGARVNYKEGSVRTINLPPGESTEFKAELEPGTYEIYCPVGSHREQGMRGTLTVEEG